MLFCGGLVAVYSRLAGAQTGSNCSGSSICYCLCAIFRSPQMAWVPNSWMHTNSTRVAVPWAQKNLAGPSAVGGQFKGAARGRFGLRRRFPRGLNGSIVKFRNSMPTNIVPKSVDISDQVLGFTVAGGFDLLNGIGEGTAGHQRVGRRVKNVALSIRGNIAPNTAVGAIAHDASFIRYLVIYDKFPNGTTPNLSDLLQDVAVAGTLTNDAKSGLNLINRDRFLVLRDRAHIMPAIGAAGATAVNQENLTIDTTSDSKYSINLTEYISLKGLMSQYNTTTAVITAITAGSIYMICLSSQDASAVNTNASWIAQFTCRLRFWDQG